MQPAFIGLFLLEIHRILKGVIDYSVTLLTDFSSVIGLPFTEPAAARRSSSLVHKSTMFTEKIFPCDMFIDSDRCNILKSGLEDSTRLMSTPGSSSFLFHHLFQLCE